MAVFYNRLSHFVADTEEELHAFARAIGLKRRWYQEKGILSHYDLTTPRAMQRAAAAGAIEISPKEIVKKLRKRKEG